MAVAKRTSNRATKKKPQKKPIESYDHKDKKRANNPPVGLVTPETDPDHGKKTTYEYDPRISIDSLSGRARPSNESFWMIGQPDVEVRRDEGTEGRRDARRGSIRRGGWGV